MLWLGLKIRATTVEKNVGVCRVPFHLVFSFHLIYPIGQKCFVIISPGARFAYLMNERNAGEELSPQSKLFPDGWVGFRVPAMGILRWAHIYRVANRLSHN